MLRVGLTGDLGSGKSTVAAMFAARGAVTFSSDEIARGMMQPGEAVYAQIIERFGTAVVQADGSLDRRRLASLAFEGGQVEELNAIVHPAVLEEQARVLAELAESQPHAIVVVESALLFTTRHGVTGQPRQAVGNAIHRAALPLDEGGSAAAREPTPADEEAVVRKGPPVLSTFWQERFDRIVLVRAPEEQKIARFVARLSAGRSLSTAERAALEDDARARLRLQSPSNEAHAAECLVIENSGSLLNLTEQVDATWGALLQAESATR